MKKWNKKGLSGVVTTILLILLIMVAIGAVWITVKNMIDEGTEGISLDSLTLDLKIISAKINFTAPGYATVRVRRNSGEGELTGIKFLVEDTLGSDVFERKFDSFEPLEERTFILDFAESEFLSLPDIHKISIIGTYLGTSGVKEITGGIADSIGKLNAEIDDAGDEKPKDTTQYCTTDAGCPDDTPIEGQDICNIGNTEVMQVISTFRCITEVGICSQPEQELVTKTVCTPEQHCFEGECISNTIMCNIATVETDCGVDGLVGDLSCHPDNDELVVQDYKTYSCTNSLCESTSILQTIENCSIINPGYQCVNGNCVDVPECVSDSDCEPQDFCNDLGICELETALNNGTVASIWPFGKGEYFDSPNLATTPEEGDYRGTYIVFPQSSEDRCLSLVEHVYPENEIGNAYVRMMELDTNISSGLYYEIWERDYICTQTDYYL